MSIYSMQNDPLHWQSNHAGVDKNADVETFGADEYKIDISSHKPVKEKVGCYEYVHVQV